MSAIVPSVAVVAKKCLCRMARGEAFAIRTAGFLVGYYLACPACGRVLALLADENVIREEPALTVDPFSCTRCSGRFRLDAGLFERVVS